MGYGHYSLEAHQALITSRSTDSVFARNDCDPKMDPHGVKYRESRDSAEHPESVSIVFALDVSGSMGDIPRQLATKTLPTFMESVLTVLPHPQVMFMAFGNAGTDRSALQVGQFESEAALIDRWLSATHLEGAGGGLGESYDLAMYFASRHTKMDCLEKRGKKGYFFMTGDEPAYSHLPPAHVKRWIGGDLGEQIACYDMVAELLRSFEAFFLIPDPVRAKIEHCEGVWRTLLNERCVVLATPEDTAIACALLVGITERVLTDRAAIERQLETRFARTGHERDRVVTAVLPYAEALAKGPIAPPGRPGIRKDVPNTRG